MGGHKSMNLGSPGPCQGDWARLQPLPALPMAEQGTKQQQHLHWSLGVQHGQQLQGIRWLPV